MGIEFSSVVDSPRADVFAWHTRPGAFTRLSPPWQPLRLVSEADSVADGQAVLGMPAGLRWVAQHQAGDYDPPARFVDTLSSSGLASLPAKAVLSWRHVHDFEEVDGDRTRVIDHVETPVPAALLNSTFIYRHRQLAEDLAAHRWAADRGIGPTTVAISGASGFVGSALAAFLSTGGHSVIRLVRHPARHSGERTWDPENPARDLLDGVDAVVHLAGASIAGRFTDKHKAVIRDSRIEPTRRLAALAADSSARVFVSASAIGFYGADRGDKQLTETSARGEGFLADLVADWEDATAPAQRAGIRVANVRTGIVQSPGGGTLQLLRPLFLTGLGGKLGDGQQWLSWIDFDDLLDIYHRALFDDAITGPVNAVAPEAVRNIDYTKTLAHVLKRPAVLPVPSFGPRLMLGKEGVEELALANQQVVPDVLSAAGHQFRRPNLEESLRHQLGRAR
ncbi:TIGR01777 family oxidoreductase [Antrihabitans sp. YC2-6]|uniref:TIGR01777 family oxidoreductase n=1 Tax=Antrihabitans sp. YC2-6 TaxID=2799498 RepID=UPI0018F6818C|nr:TIGR01777 family oxidoreductase [Antrihabitans sp. YC2-6]MBJ8346517.1 TIGR01777 family oxidoreductase [Antrihabitans sp. YC2-6]